MLDYLDIDFNAGNGPQRGAMREVLQNIFRSERSLVRFLDEALDLRLEDLVSAQGSYADRSYELVRELSNRGKLSALVRALSDSPEYSEAPALRTLRGIWPNLATPDLKARANTPDRPALASVIDNQHARLQPVSWLARLLRRRHSLALLRGQSGSATGFLVGPDCMLTAALSDPVCEALFDSEDSSSIPARCPVAKLIAGRGEAADIGSTYAMWRLEPPPAPDGGVTRPWLDLNKTRSRLTVGEPVFLLHFPDGAGMRLSEGKIVDSDPASSRFSHDAATMPGSAGAPVLDLQLRLIGLHAESNGKRSPQGLAIRADHIARDLGRKGIALSPAPLGEAG